MQLVIKADGNIWCLYAEAIDLALLGSVCIERGSHVEPDDQARWFADLSPVIGPLLGPFSKRSDALQAEIDWLTAHWLQA